MRKIGAYLTRRNENYFIITSRLPVVMAVDGTDRIDVWPEPGDRLTLNYICDYIVSIVGEKAELMEVGKPEKIWISAGFQN